MSRACWLCEGTGWFYAIDGDGWRGWWESCREDGPHPDRQAESPPPIRSPFDPSPEGGKP